MTTKQELFTQIATHLLTQNVQSKSTHGGCVYRGPGGLKCAVGCVLTNDEYLPSMDSPHSETGVASLIRRGVLPQRLIPFASMLESLQFIHDDLRPQDWPKELAEYAQRHNLEMPDVPVAA